MEDGQYEEERQKIIADNQKLLASLGLNGFASNAPSSNASSSAPASKRKAATPSKNSSARKKVKVTVAPPARSSMRLRGQTAKTEEDVQAIEEFNANLEKENLKNRYLARKIRKPVMRLNEMMKDDDLDADDERVKALQNTLHDLSLQSHPRPAKLNEDYEDLTPDAVATVKADQSLRELYSNVRFVNEVKTTGNRSYSLLVHPDPTRCLTISGDKRGMLGFWDADAVVEDVTDEDGEVSAGSPKDNVWQVQAHQASSISCLRWNPVDSQTLYTSSYDCSIRRFDLSTSTSTEIFASPDPDALFNHFDLTPDGNQIWLSDSDGGMNHLDMRESKNIRRRFVIAESLSAAGKKVGGFAINPVEPWLVCSAHNDRNMRVWDLRYIDKVKLQPFEFDAGLEPAKGLAPPHDSTNYPTLGCEWSAISDYEEKHPKNRILRARAPHGLSCSSAYWDMSGKRILTTSYDDKIRVWDANPNKFITNSSTENLKQVWSARHDTQVGRWVTVFKAQWSPYADVAPHVAVGHMKRRITILSGLTGQAITDMTHPDITAVPAVVAMHPGRPGTVVGANASGKVMRFAAGETA